MQTCMIAPFNDKWRLLQISEITQFIPELLVIKLFVFNMKIDGEIQIIAINFKVKTIYVLQTAQESYSQASNHFSLNNVFGSRKRN